MTIIIFLLVLLVCVIAHEWGHFFAARKSGMLVEEFGFGIPPRIWGKKKGETLYSINALPIGGFVKIAGENGLQEGVLPERQFDTKPWYKKSLVLIAGVVMNILLALVLFSVANMLGMPTITEDGTPTIVAISTNSPAQQAGLRVGDQVRALSIDGVSSEVLQTEALRAQIIAGAKEVVLFYQRGDVVNEVVLIPEGEGGARMIGLGVEPIGTAQQSFTQSISAAWKQTWTLVGAIWDTLSHLVVGIVTKEGDGVSGLMGPVGLANEVRGAATIGFAYLLAFTAVISVNLAVLNIMPFPALDGGRLLVVLLETIFKKRFSKKVVGYIHGIGFLLLIVLMVVLTVGDIRKLL